MEIIVSVNVFRNSTNVTACVLQSIVVYSVSNTASRASTSAKTKHVREKDDGKERCKLFKNTKENSQAFSDL